MLVEFSVGNYKSFKDPVTLSMVAARRLASRDRTLDQNTVIPIDDSLSLLTSAAVYGANASGKSNLADAFKFMKSFVINSSKDTQVSERIPVEPYALDPETINQPTHFEVICILQGTQYRYGFDVDAARVVREWLYYVPKHKEELLFQREGDQFTLAAAFEEGEKLASRTRENALFLSVVAQFNGKVAILVTMWFSSFAVISGLDDKPTTAVSAILLDLKNELSQQIQKIVRLLDVGIQEIKVESDDGSNARIKTIHRAYARNGEPASLVTFDMEMQESEGTQKIIALAGTIVLALELGYPILIDEFDARLHPLLTRELVRLFNSTETNPEHAQLIFMTHDTNLLDKEMLRRDQIWFVEKDPVGATHLYSLAEIGVRNDASYERDYIQGKYGAIPFIGDLRRVMEDVSA